MFADRVPFFGRTPACPGPVHMNLATVPGLVTDADGHPLIWDMRIRGWVHRGQAPAGTMDDAG